MEAALEDLEREQRRVEDLICQRNDELMRREGLYADLYRKQLLEQEIPELG